MIDILKVILSALHPFLTLPNDVLKYKRGTFFLVSSDLMKGPKRYLFCSWKRCSQKRQKNLGSWKWCCQKWEKSTFIKSLKKCKIVFSSHGKPFRILLIDRCQPFGAILWIFLSEFTNPDKYSQFDGQVWKQLLSLTLWQCQVAVLKSIPRAWFWHGCEPPWSVSEWRWKHFRWLGGYQWMTGVSYK